MVYRRLLSGVIAGISPHHPNPTVKREKLVEILAKYMPRIFSQVAVKDLENTPDLCVG